MLACNWLQSQCSLFSFGPEQKQLAPDSSEGASWEGALPNPTQPALTTPSLAGGHILLLPKAEGSAHLAEPHLAEPCLSGSFCQESVLCFDLLPGRKLSWAGLAPQERLQLCPSWPRTTVPGRFNSGEKKHRLMATSSVPLYQLRFLPTLDCRLGLTSQSVLKRRGGRVCLHAS